MTANVKLNYSFLYRTTVLMGVSNLPDTTPLIFHWHCSISVISQLFTMTDTMKELTGTRKYQEIGLSLSG